MTEKNLAEHAISARSRVNLLEAMRGEAFAFAKYKLFARRACANADNDLADLFDKTADQEYLEHFTEQADLLQLVGTDEQTAWRRSSVATDSDTRGATSCGGS